MNKKECSICNGEGAFFNNCWSPGEDEWINCSTCNGEGEVEKKLKMTMLKN